MTETLTARSRIPELETAYRRGEIDRRGFLRAAMRLGISASAAYALAGRLEGASFASKASAQTILKIVPHADLKNVDPIWTTAYITRNHGYMVYDTLFAMDENLTPQPQMVGDYSVSDDKLVFTLTLREGLSWHDGGPVTAEDCVASLMRWGKRDGMGQKLFTAVDRLEAVDEGTLKLTLKEPYGLVLESIGKISSNVPFMMPKRLAETDPFEQVPEVIGSGPFKFMADEWVPGSLVVYEKFADYVPRDEPVSAAAGGKIAKVDRCEWHYIPDPQTAMNALINGEIHYWEQPPADLAPLLEQHETIKVEVLDPLGNQGMLRMNHLWPPFDKPEIRQAVLWMMKQEDFLRAGVGDPKYWDTCYSFFPCPTPLANEVGIEPLKEQDFERAKAMLQEAGYDGTKVVILQPTDIPVTNAASLVTAQILRQAGMNVELQAMDWATVTSRRAVMEPPDKGGWNIFHTWWIGADVANPISNIGISGGCKEQAWYGWPCDQKLEDLRNAFAYSTDPEKQKELAKQIQARAFEIVTYGNFGTFFNPVAYRSNVRGMIPSPVQFFWNMEIVT